MAITKERKQEMVDEYVDWLDRSRALIVADYKGLSMKDLDDLRARLREVGGEFHIVKNTLGKIAFEKAGWEIGEDFLEGATAIGLAFEDAPATAKTLSEFARGTDFLTIRGGYLDKALLTADEVKALAELPPLPEMRAKLLGTIMAPASQLARVLAEPGRQLAAVIQAYVDQQQGGGEAEAAT